MSHSEFLGSFRAVKFTGNRFLDGYIKARASLYRGQGWRYTQPWFLRPDARQTAIVFGLAGNLALVFVALPMAVNAVVDYKADVAEQSEYSRAHAAVTREMVLTLLNEQRAEEGLPPATHLLCDDTVHDDHHDAGRSALADFDAIWCQVEESMASQAEAPSHPATGER